ncbi:hypothetical protein B0H10DRAFT_2206453 [Mycena sp. CBHHK59/15]|nr:hypothetical protein B0H10DRAFT_2206453 [Mycena sp. CBHHK59/15]
MISPSSSLPTTSSLPANDLAANDLPTILNADDALTAALNAAANLISPPTSSRPNTEDGPKQARLHVSLLSSGARLSSRIFLLIRQIYNPQEPRLLAWAQVLFVIRNVDNPKELPLLGWVQG